MNPAVEVVIVDEGNTVLRFEPGPDGVVKTGAVWGPAADSSGEWFGLRLDIDDGEPRRLPSRAEAVAWLDRPKAVPS